MEWVSGWIQGIIIAVIISTIIEMILPEGNSKKYINQLQQLELISKTKN